MIKANIIKTKMCGKLIMILVDENKKVKINIDNSAIWLTPEQLLEYSNDKKDYNENKKDYNELKKAIKESKDYDELTTKIMNDMKKGRSKVEVARVLLDEEKYENYKAE